MRIIKNNGFTLIEIIVVILLISGIGTASAIMINKSNKDTTKQIKKIDNLILEAANIFVENEKDDSGNTYAYAIQNGAKGVEIPVKTLIEKGYVDERKFAELVELNNKDSNNKPMSINENYYVAVINGIEASLLDNTTASIESESDHSQITSYCENGELTYKLSWKLEDEENDPVYLCASYGKKKEIEVVNPNILNMSDNYNITFNKYAISKTCLDNILSNTEESKKESKQSYYTTNENGIFLETINESEETISYRYYRGGGVNNYVKLGKINGNDIIWRILWFKTDSKNASNSTMKLVLDSLIDLRPINGINLKKGDKIWKFDGNYYINATTTKDENKSVCYEKKRYDYCKNYFLINCPSGSCIKTTSSPIGKEDDFYTINSADNLWHQSLIKWYDETDLKNYDYIIKNYQYCINSGYDDKSYSGEEDYRYLQSNNFVCTGNGSGSYQSPVGFLTYGEVLRAGVPEISGTQNSTETLDNFILENTNNQAFMISDIAKREEVYARNSNGYKYMLDVNHYIVNNGLTKTNLVFHNSSSTQGKYGDFIYYKTDSNGSWIANQYSEGRMYEFYVVADKIKPTIVVSLKDKKITENGGTKENPYVFIDK